MELPNYYLNILVSVVIGISSSIVFDFFRSLRKLKKTRNSVVMLQDIIYFLIILFIIITAIYFYLDEAVRMYMVISIGLGAFIYFKLFSRFVIEFYIFILKRLESIFSFFNITIKFHFDWMKKIIKILHKFVKKCCKKNINMINYLCNKLRQMVPKRKKKVYDEKL